MQTSYIIMIKNSQVTVLVAILTTLAVSAVVIIPIMQLPFIANANGGDTKGVNGGTPCAHSNDGLHNTATVSNITIFVCDD